ncbi:hypothetical protein CP985_03440 [Malaciobacter mytili LMG 24559]|uniref:Uncharacterized protein n=1 Tax=Malaciobacter mytili LMG 24559 TaxID=1032238 RepID=A0AAX2AI00_9BACT|nr:hypothetical protein [Malaciobacter mytili]AXH16411.1 putative membrane protein [Malaciobacter mytili LMG 24559]RXK16478.1 hypothetical protein CP985_03440 [Malaciobacter mytili LMG 24559]
MFQNLKNGFKKTKDKRVKFNAIFGGLILVFVLFWMLYYINAKIIYEVYKIELFLNYLKNFYLLIVFLLISSYFANKIYFWHFQKDKLLDVITKEQTNKSTLTIFEKIELVTFLLYKDFHLILLSIMFILVLTNYKIIDVYTFPIVSLITIFIYLRILINNYKRIDSNILLNIEYTGIVTDYSTKEEK